MASETNCPHCDSALSYEIDGQTYYRSVGVEVRGVYDGALFYYDVECGWAWHRWPEGSDLYNKAVPYVGMRNRKVLEREGVS